MRELGFYEGERVKMGALVGRIMSCLSRGGLLDRVVVRGVARGLNRGWPLEKSDGP